MEPFFQDNRLYLSRTVSTASSYNTWKPLAGFDVSTNQEITLLFIQSQGIHYPSVRYDPIFPAETLIEMPNNESSFYTNEDPRATVLGCVDESNICWGNGDECFKDVHNPELDGEHFLEKTGYHLLLQGLKQSTIEHAVHFGGGTTLDASSRLEGMYSMQLATEQWKVEVRRAFETSLARMQISIRDMSLGISLLGDGDMNNPTSDFQDVCHVYKFRSEGWTTFSLAGLLLWSLGALAVYALGVEVEVSEDIEAQNRDKQLRYRVRGDGFLYSSYLERDLEELHPKKGTRFIVEIISSWFWAQFRKIFAAGVLWKKRYGKSNSQSGEVGKESKSMPGFDHTVPSLTRIGSTGPSLERHDKLKEVRDAVIPYILTSRKSDGQLVNFCENENGIVDLHFDVAWDLLSFMRTYTDQGAGADLASVITLSGFSLSGQATTCGAYLKQNWPSTGIKVLSVLQEALDSSQKRASGM